MFCGVLSQGQYLQMELLRTSRDNDSGKMQQVMKMFAVSQVARAEICSQGGQGKNEVFFFYQPCYMNVTTCTTQSILI